MTFILALLAIILLISGIAFLFINPVKLAGETSDINYNTGKRITTPNEPNKVAVILHKLRLPSIVFGLVLLFLANSFIYSRPGHLYYILYPTGGTSVIVKNGYKFVMPLSTVQEWDRYFDIKTIIKGEATEGIEGVIKDGIPIRFIDKVTGTLQIAVRVEIPTDPESFINLVEEFRHPQNLINNTLIPTIREQVINTAYMFSAEDYVSGDASNFRVTLDDQLKNGGFAVDKIEKTDTINSGIQISGEREIDEIKTFYMVEKRLDASGNPIRIEHDIKKNHIIVSQVIVQAIDLEPKFKAKLETQRDLSAQRGIEIQKIGVAQAAQKSIIAEGERDKAAESVKQQLVQVKTLIAIETKLKEEETNRKLAIIQLETEKLASQALRVKKDAEAYAATKLVAAGLTPTERAEWDYKTAVGVATQLKELKLPTTYINGGNSSKGGSGLLETLIGAELAKQMMGGPPVINK
jgi:hypothetical protein